MERDLFAQRFQRAAERAREPIAIEPLEQLGLELPRIPRWVAIPRALRSLVVRAPEAADEDVRRLLARCPVELESVDVGRTPASDAILTDLQRFANLRYLNALDTGITPAALRRVFGGRPRFKCSPRLEPLP